MIQTIIGSVLTILLKFVIFFNTTFFTHWWIKNCGKKIRSHDQELRMKRELPSATHSLDNVAHVKFSDPSDSKSSPETPSKKPLYMSISVKAKELKQNFTFYISSKTKQEISAYLLLFILTTFFTTVQVLIIHGFAKIERINLAKNYTTINTMCNMLEENFLLEELIYLIPALMFFLVLWFYHRKRRFNKYIMVKFKRYFKTSYFKKLQAEQKILRKQEIKESERMLKKQGQCGKCRYVMYKCFKNSFCRIFCCVFCCSCFVPHGTNNRCFICYCCYQGWKQTDLHKVIQGKTQ